jgi:hypothetical protein
MRQRIRWAKGHLQAFVETGWQLFSHIFYTGGAANRDMPKSKHPIKDLFHDIGLLFFGSKEKESFRFPITFKRFINNIRLRFMSFDMLTVVFPYSLLSDAKKLIIFILRLILVIWGSLKVSVYYGPEFIGQICKFFGLSNLSGTGSTAIFWLIFTTLAWELNSYINAIFTAVYVFIIEHRRIKKIKWYKKVWYCLTFPIFDIIGRISMIIALFIKVEWKPIPHNSSISINEIEKVK